MLVLGLGRLGGEIIFCLVGNGLEDGSASGSLGIRAQVLGVRVRVVRVAGAAGFMNGEWLK